MLKLLKNKNTNKLVDNNSTLTLIFVQNVKGI